MIEPLGHGGVWESTCHLSNALRRHGEIAILTSSDYDPSVLDDGITVLPYVLWQQRKRWWHRGKVGKLINGLANISGYIKALSHAFHACPVATYPVVHFQGIYWPPLVLATVVAARLQGRQVVYSPHNSFSRNKSAILRRLWVGSQRLICRPAVTVIAHTAFDRRRLLESRISRPESIRVIPLGSFGTTGSVRSMRQARSHLQLSPVLQYVLFLGYLRPDKGLDELLAILPKLVSRIPTARILVVGEDIGGSSSRLVRSLASDSKAYVEFRPGYVPSESLPDYFAAADVVCIPYRQASDSAVARWALAHLRPVVAYDVGGLREALKDHALVHWAKSGDRAALLQELLGVLQPQGPPTRQHSPGGEQSILDWTDIAELTWRTYWVSLDSDGR